MQEQQQGQQEEQEQQQEQRRAEVSFPSQKTQQVVECMEEKGDRARFIWRDLSGRKRRPRKPHVPPPPPFQSALFSTRKKTANKNRTFRKRVRLEGEEKPKKMAAEPLLEKTRQFIERRLAKQLRPSGGRIMKTIAFDFLGGMSGEFRVTARYLPSGGQMRFVPTLELATVMIEDESQRGKGYFRILLQSLEELALKYQRALYIESVIAFEYSPDGERTGKSRLLRCMEKRCAERPLYWTSASLLPQEFSFCFCFNAVLARCATPGDFW